MKSAHESKKDHILRGALEARIKATIDNDEIVSLLVEEVLSALDEQNIIQYSTRSNLNVLTPMGRIWALLLEKPGLTIKEMSVTMGVTESNINKAVSKLLAEKLIVKKRIHGRYEYRVNHEAAKEHQDIRRLVLFIARLLSEK